MKNIKRYIHIFIALFIIFPCITNAATELSAATQNPTVGSYVFVQLEVNYGETLRIGDFHVYIDYDTSYFELEDVIWVKLGDERGTSEIQNGRVYIDKENGNWKSGPVVQLKLRVLRAGFSEITIGRNGESYYTNGDVIAQSMASIYINAQEPNNDTIIGSLYVEGYSMQPTFSKTHFNYNLTVPSNVTSVNVIATPGNNKQSLSGNGKILLNYGPNRVKVIVTAQDKSTSTYEIMITRTDDRTGDTNLKGLSVSNTSIAYENGKTVYDAIVSRSIENIMITGRTADPNATLVGTGSKKLEMGLNTFELKVQSSGGKEQIYTINITRSNEELQTAKKSSKLMVLKVNSLILDLSSNKTTFLYGIGKEFSELSIDTITESTTAKVEIIGNEKLTPGFNPITVKVTEKLEGDTEEVTEYKIIVYKNPNKATVIKDLNNSNETTDILYSTTKTNSTIPRNLVSNLKSSNTKLYYNIVNMSNGLLYQFLLSKDLPDSDIDASISIVNESPLTYKVNLPKGTKITAYVEDYYMNDTDVKIYSYDNEYEYTLVTAGVKVQNGYITFSTNGQKNYVITTNDLIKEQSEFDKLLNKYSGIIIAVIGGLIAIITLSILISKKKEKRESNEPLY
jgi:hypothetical protein